MKVKSGYLTSIEQVFKLEYSLIRFGGGFLVDSPSLKFVLYRAFVIILTKLTSLYYDRTKAKLSVFPKISAQYVELFYTVYHCVSCATIIATVLSSIKYHNVVAIILKKRLDHLYINLGGKGSSHVLTEGIIPNVNSRGIRHRQKSFHGARRTSRIFLTKIFFLSNLLIIILKLSFDFAPDFLPSIWSKGINSSNELEIEAVRIKSSSSDWSKSLGTQDSSSQLRIETDSLSIYSLLSQTPSILKLLAIITFTALLQVLSLIQNYGHAYVVLIITATISEMLNFACTFDGLCPGAEATRSFVLSPPRRSSSESSALDQRTASGSDVSDARSRRPLLTTKLLIQVRDALIMLRCAFSLDYLMILISDLCRMTSVFSMLNTALVAGRIDLCLQFILEYLSIILNTLIARIGYHWVHVEVTLIKRSISEIGLLQSDVQSSYGDVEIPELSQSEKLTTDRLADDLFMIWPTDWFTPDITSVIRSNIFAVTFVATLQQLVEAGSKTESVPLSNNQSSSNDERAMV